MSKIRIGDKVIVKETGSVGTVISRETTKLDGNKVKVEYIVKTGNGFESYKPLTRKEIVKTSDWSKFNPLFENGKTYPRFYSHVHKCKDGRTLIITGIVDTFHEDILGDVMFKHNVKKKYLSVGYAICHPSDKNDLSVGTEISVKRAYDKPLAYLETPFTGEFKEDFVNVILKSKAEFVEENIERFIDRDKTSNV